MERQDGITRTDVTHFRPKQLLRNTSKQGASLTTDATSNIHMLPVDDDSIIAGCDQSSKPIQMDDRVDNAI